jgi:hypothetical protein
MYRNTPLELSKYGISDYFDKLEEKADDTTKDEILQGMEICQENNVFEFKEQL